MGLKGSSLRTEPFTIGIYSSKSSTSSLAIFVFACPLSPKKFISCFDKIALSKSGITVSSYPCISVKISFFYFLYLIRLSLNSSLIDLDFQPEFFNAARVVIFKYSIINIF